MYLQPAEEGLPMYIAELLGLAEDVRGGMWADVQCAPKSPTSELR